MEGLISGGEGGGGGGGCYKRNKTKHFKMSHGSVDQNTFSSKKGHDKATCPVQYFHPADRGLYPGEGGRGGL